MEYGLIGVNVNYSYSKYIHSLINKETAILDQMSWIAVFDNYYLQISGRVPREEIHL